MNRSSVSSEQGRLSLFSSTTIPDLTNNIIQPETQYCEAGGFGDVFRCRFSSDNGVKEVAVKAFRFSFTLDERKRDEGKFSRMIRRELGIWRRLDHRNIVPFLGIAYGFGRRGSASLVSSWMSHGTLHAFLEAHEHHLDIPHRLQLLLDIANGLEYLHSLPLIHGDLSSNNVLLDHNYNACLSDFGCASLLGELPDGFAYLKMSTMRPGTLRWAAPEHFSLSEEETKATIKSDIYSFGNMALLILSGKYPWSEVRVDAAVILRLSQGLKPARPFTPQIDDRHWELIERCWSSIPERPLAHDAVTSLQQLLGTYPPIPALSDVLDAPIPPYIIASDNDDSDAVEPNPSPSDRTQTRTLTSMIASTSTVITEGHAQDSSLTACLDHAPRSSPPASDARSIKSKSEQSIANDPEDNASTAHCLLTKLKLGTSWSNTIVARNLPTYLEEGQLQEFFQRLRELKNFRLLREDGNKLSKGIAVFEYVDASVTDVAVRNLHGVEIGEQRIVVQREEFPSGANEIHQEQTVRDSILDETSPTPNLTESSHSNASQLSPKWVRGELIGKGTYGHVYLGLNVSTGEMIAIKQVKRGHKKGHHLDLISELRREREILSELDHPHIIAYIGSEETTTHLSIFMEYIPGGSIAHCLQGHGQFSENVIKCFAAQIFDGLAYLHAKGIIHRNIEPNCILVEGSGICKISGFGNAQRVDDGASWIPMRGIVDWTAPEVVQAQDGKRYGPKVDVWSAGCVVLRMWTWRNGYAFPLLIKAMRQGMPPSLPSDLAVDFRDQCLAIDPEARASAADLARHPYLTLPPDWVFTELN